MVTYARQDRGKQYKVAVGDVVKVEKLNRSREKVPLPVALVVTAPPLPPMRRHWPRSR